MRPMIWISIKQPSLQNRLLTEFKLYGESIFCKVQLAKKANSVVENDSIAQVTGIYLTFLGVNEWLVSDRQPPRSQLSRGVHYEFPFKMSELVHQIHHDTTRKFEFTRKMLQENPKWVGGYFLIAKLEKIENSVENKDKRGSATQLLEFALKNVIRSRQLQEKLIAVYQRSIYSSLL
jgi:hypothetical protein